MGNVRQMFVEKKDSFDIEAKGLLSELKQSFNLKNLNNVRVLNRYQMEGVDEEVYAKSKFTIFAEPTVDIIYENEVEIKNEDRYFLVEYLPGQYDQRADSAAQCVQIISKNEKPVIKSAKLIILEGILSDEEFYKIKNYCINPVDSQEAEIALPLDINIVTEVPANVANVEGFIDMDEDAIKAYRLEMGFAMSDADIIYVQDYFKNKENRDPKITELKVLDTYWSDHCRHTTFMAAITDVIFEQGDYTEEIKSAYDNYLDMRLEINSKKDMSLMDIAVVGMKHLKTIGKLDDLDESEEINACSINIKADINGTEEDWLLMFKNETHNHPTEIEPFGGAATCLGGAIRDPLSGRSYVYQAMRVTGSGNPNAKIEDTIPGKLPQKKITTEAAHGYSSYGNQIGLATGQVSEVYDEGYIAKRMEVGAVVGAAPKKNVKRIRPVPGDKIILVGGKTGRDGCGGATGSSKEHTEESLMSCGAEVQKGNPPTERNIQRLFRREDVATLIKKCNDFGAGGVSVAIGELADSLEVNLDLVSKKYDGLDGTELAISESQERMAVVVDAKDVDQFIAYSDEENLEAVEVAKVTDTGRFKMMWRGDAVLDMSREFIETNGIKQTTKIKVNMPKKEDNYFALESKKEGKVKDIWFDVLRDLNNASQKGLTERFDSTIGAGTVLMPLGGKYQMTPAEGMAAKLPITEGQTNTASLMAYGFNPKIANWSAYHSALYAVIDSITKIVAMGGDYSKVRLSFQEYFEKLGDSADKWGKPFAALLGALKVQKELGVAAIGGKDSMSGTFNDIHVPPTLISFAVDTVDSSVVMSPELKKTDSTLVLVSTRRDKNEIIDFEQYKENMDLITQLISDGKVLSVKSVGQGGVMSAVSKMMFGNMIGTRIEGLLKEEMLEPAYGSMVVEVEAGSDILALFKTVEFKVIGQTLKEAVLDVSAEKINIKELYDTWVDGLEKVFPTKDSIDGHVKKESFTTRLNSKGIKSIAKPKVFIPAFPGTNCEMDSKRAFDLAGADTTVQIFRNLTTEAINESVKEMVKNINESQIIMIPGGFSGGDEPDGSAKFITSVFRNPEVMEAVMKHIKDQDGLMIGICNGFQALIKLGLVTYGEIREASENDPTLTFNRIGRHVSSLVQTRIASVKSPWFANVEVDDIHTIPVSHGEGRFIANEAMYQSLSENGQIATQYVDLEGNPTMDIRYNPNGSIGAVEGITSIDGKILGKMGHSERIGDNLYRNVIGNYDQKIFASGVAYFK